MTIKDSKQLGARIAICDTPAELVKAKARGLIAFSRAEVRLLPASDLQAWRDVITVKRAYPHARVVEHGPHKG